MNCQNCGGAMELSPARGYFFCRYCGSFHFPESKGDDGIRVVSEASDATTCSLCNQPLASAILDDAHPARYCRNCRGVLIARKSFAAVVEHRRAWATGTPGPPVLLNKTDLDRKAQCPVCKGRMLTHPYYGPGNVVIDSCVSCELVWLDFGELKQIVDAPGRDRGTRQMPRPVMGEPFGNSITGARPVGSDAGDLLSLLSRLF
jgi:Zn-finger nucleic acid-binding protein